ncbi:DUF6525 family protein [Marinibacterium profundimaris]|uniref:DUF6525 family protein n=1 Tax=Marinibacterium profundimaris TaxID=1679460 RepID=UPI000B528BE9|nr:DUF6525 family protein [Marinibacterium profundimaris]
MSGRYARGSGNLGETRLRRRRRQGDPMRSFDALPGPLRRWMAGAALPWSPVSCRRIWEAARARGDSVEAALDRLDRAERAALLRGAGPGACGDRAHPACPEKEARA